MALRAKGNYFLTHVDGQFSVIFKRCLVFCGLDPKLFGMHSFRMGAATVADAGGLPHKD